jgi:hypothetical protein
MAGPYTSGIGYAYTDVWDVPVIPVDSTPVGSAGEPTKRSPWALGSEITLTAGSVSGFLVKTTQMYGFVATKTNPTYNDHRIAHNWSYSGSVKVNGVTLTLPITLAQVATATGVTVGTAVDGSKYIDFSSHKVRFLSQRDVILARTTWGGTGAGLSDDGLVTSVELHSDAMALP